MRKIIVLVAAVILVGCPAPATRPSKTVPTQQVEPDATKPIGPSQPEKGLRDTEPRQQEITTRYVSTSAEVEALPEISQGEYRIHLIDVGTGLSILIQGHDFNMLYDAGSKDDFQGGENSRAVAYLWAALGASRPTDCQPADEKILAAWKGGAEQTINHVVLSHAHSDHGNMLDEVLTCYRAEDVWDPGAINDADFYREWWQAVANEQGAHIHTVADIWPNRTKILDGQTIKIDASTPWSTIIGGQVVQLGDGARFKVLYANADHPKDPNRNTLVIRVDLGATSLLLTGDAEAGKRRLPSEPVGDIEKHLIDHFATDIDVDILQVGHHGSITSSRNEFLKRVSPEIALIGVGPKMYGKVRFPEVPVLQALEQVGAKVYATDVTDKKGCPVADRIGSDSLIGKKKERPGGCDNFVLDIR